VGRGVGVSVGMDVEVGGRVGSAATGVGADVEDGRGDRVGVGTSSSEGLPQAPKNSSRHRTSAGNKSLIIV
jgi:hypothetical protein